MNVSKILKPCPFCGEYPSLVVCDSEGNIKGKLGNNEALEYEKDPYSGLGYQLAHEYNNLNPCPIATNEGETVGAIIYDLPLWAVNWWNRRKGESFIKNLILFWKIGREHSCFFSGHDWEYYPKGYPYKPIIKICNKCGKREKTYW